ncbi:lysylphosphatidylglycerol synthase domain-containing protein [Silvanigrella aquatica]|uniref:Flippase-like domain-containing protein n=1 Tax=Silvanigrella aquatica TaxID=1915309 RepID=A0A1L4CX24_9BACT|nr:lysylphosphatidylglycerol synthase domain-containing protein [Silvanigrella aquatica]APJ02503.1 hypothetical protein AXG55_00565 [Silvanigrella aquatica]
MKTLIKIIILFIISVFAIHFMYSNNIIDVKNLLKAFESHKKLILLVAFIQILNCLFMTFRYFSLLKIFKIKVDFQNVVAATFVSNGIGQWLPGSMAFIEVLRIGLMLGADKDYNFKANQIEKSEVKENLEELAIRSKLAAVSIMDRLIGLLVMLIFGLIMTALIYLKTEQGSIASSNLIAFFIVTFLFFIFLLALPLFSGRQFFRKLFTRIERIVLSYLRNSFLNKLIRKLFVETNSLLDALALGSRKISYFWKPVFFSIICLLLASSGMFFSGMAISGRVPFEAILATMSILSIASILPIGLAGMGGMQIIAAIVFSLFEISSQNAVSAQLLQTAVNLLAISLMGILFARLSAKQIRAIVLSKKSENFLTNKNM